MWDQLNDYSHCWSNFLLWALYGAHKSCWLYQTLHMLIWNQAILWETLIEDFLHFSTVFHSTWTFHSMEYLSSLLFASFLLFEMCRLTGTEETVRAATKRLTQGMADFNKAISSAKTEEEKTKIVSLWFSRLKNIMDRQSFFKNHVLIPANWLWCECFFAEKRSTDCNKDNAVI